MTKKAKKPEKINLKNCFWYAENNGKPMAGGSLDLTPTKKQKCECVCHNYRCVNCNCKWDFIYPITIPIPRAWLERLDELYQNYRNAPNLEYEEELNLLIGYLESVRELLKG